ncbi:MAG: hypothetical protein JF571_04485, partial [Asticcacaulis sp.]|nr:hypothetical protein [Asticcacaulis sp.]
MRNCLWGGVAAMVFVSLTPVGFTGIATAADLPSGSPVHCQTTPQPAAYAPATAGNSVVVAGVRKEMKTAKASKKSRPASVRDSMARVPGVQVSQFAPPPPPSVAAPQAGLFYSPQQGQTTDTERYAHHPVATVQRVA